MVRCELWPRLFCGNFAQLETVQRRNPAPSWEDMAPRYLGGAERDQIQLGLFEFAEIVGSLWIKPPRGGLRTELRC